MYQITVLVILFSSLYEICCHLIHVASCSQGYFVQPTIIECSDPSDKIIKEEIFGPVLTVFVYEDKDIDSVIENLSNVTPYALTGAIFAQDE